MVGEAYVGDEDAGLAEIERIVHAEIAPSITGLDAFATERCWPVGYPATFDILRDRRSRASQLRRAALMLLEGLAVNTACQIACQTTPQRAAGILRPRTPAPRPCQ